MKEKVIDVICNEGVVNLQPKKLKVIKMKLCDYCLHPYKLKDLMKCSSKKCDIEICKNCATFINNKPFCNECVIDIVKFKSLLIITKGET